MTSRRSFLRILGFAPVAAPAMVAAAKAAPTVSPNEYLRTVVVGHGPTIWDPRNQCFFDHLGRSAHPSKAERFMKRLSSAGLEIVEA